MAKEFLDALQGCETLRAIRALDQLDFSTWHEKSDGVPFKDAWDAFLGLMDRRGFYISTSEQLAESLAQIRNLGEGFDLYEVARKMADLDTIVTECLQLQPRRMFPELEAFSPPCPCGNHPAKKEERNG